MGPVSYFEGRSVKKIPHGNVVSRSTRLISRVDTHGHRRRNLAPRQPWNTTVQKLPGYLPQRRREDLGDGGGARSWRQPPTVLGCSGRKREPRARGPGLGAGRRRRREDLGLVVVAAPPRPCRRRREFLEANPRLGMA